MNKDNAIGAAIAIAIVNAIINDTGDTGDMEDIISSNPDGHTFPSVDNNPHNNPNNTEWEKALWGKYSATGWHKDIEELKKKIWREANSGQYTERSAWEEQTEALLFPSLRFQAQDPDHYYGKK
jgi:hypothetical protein